MRLLGLISTLFLARLLTPADFGIVALAGLIIAVLDALTDFRFGMALVRRQDATDDDYHTAWTFNVMRGAVVAILLIAGAPLFAGIFTEPRLVDVFRVLGAIAFIDGFQNIGTVQFTKDMRFDRDFILRIGQKMSVFAISITLAFIWRSYWALIAGMLAGSSARLLLSYTMHPFRPRFCVSSGRSLFGFSVWLMGGEILALINQRLEQFLIGGFLSTPVVGVYNVSYEVAGMATGELVGPAAQALFPGFSKIAEDKARLREAYEKSVQFVVAIGTPLGIGLALVSHEFIMLVLGPKWSDATLPLQVLSVMYSISLLAMASTSLLPAIGRTRTAFFVTLIQFAARIPITTLAVWQFGLMGAVWSRFAFGITWVIHYMWVIRREIDCSFVRIFTVTWRSYAATATMVGAVFLVDKGLTLINLEQTSLVSLGIYLCVKAIIGAVAYIFSHIIFWKIQGEPNGPEQQAIQLLQSKLKLWRPSRR
jgi:lipopolysaccharide exporter